MEDLALALVPLVSYALTYALGWIFGKLPKVAIPILAGALGPAAAALASYAGSPDIPVIASVLLGAAAVAVAEFVGQVQKQAQARTVDGRVVKAEVETGLRWKEFRS